MVLSINQQPNNINLSGNPIIVGVLLTETAPPGYSTIHVRIKQNDVTLYEDSIEAIGYQPKGSEELPNEIINFDISDYLNKIKQLDLDVFDLFKRTIQSADKITDTYHLEVFETNTSDSLEHQAIDIPNFLVIHGGFSKILLNNFSTTNRSFYENTIVADKKFLSWGPEKSLTPNQHDLLFFIPVLASSQNIYARFKLYFSDETTLNVDTETYAATTETLYFVSPSILAHDLLQYEDVGKTITKYELVINNASDVAITEVRTYFIDRESYNQSRQFIFKNSLGVYDLIMLKGISESIDEIQRTVGFFQTKDIVSSSEFTEAYNANSGFLATQFQNALQAKQYIIELINSKEIYEIVNRNVIPVIPTSKKINIAKDDEFLYSFTFDYKYAYTDDYYSLIDDSEISSPVISYQNGSVANAIQGQTATLTFDAKIDDNIEMDFVIDWGADVGLTKIISDLIFDVWNVVQGTFLIPANSAENQTLKIKDAFGGTYEFPYTITQVAADILIVDILDIQGINPNGSTELITITSNGNWTISEASAWVSLSKLNGTGDDTFNIIIADNPTGSARNTSVTVSQGAIDRVINIGQDESYLSVDQNTISPIADGETIGINVTASGTWSVTESETWLSLSSSGGTGNGSFNIIVDENLTTSVKNGTVTLTQGDLTQVITVNQAAAVVEHFDITYDFSNSLTVISNTINLYEAYQVVDILPTANNRVTCDIPIPVDYALTTTTNSTAQIWYGVSSNPSTEPSTWISINSVSNGPDVTSSIDIDVADGEYLFIKIKLTRVGALNAYVATASATLTNGSPFACSALEIVDSVTASGSPLNWSKTIEDPA